MDRKKQVDAVALIVLGGLMFWAVYAAHDVLGRRPTGTSAPVVVTIPEQTILCKP